MTFDNIFQHGLINVIEFADQIATLRFRLSIVNHSLSKSFVVGIGERSSDFGVGIFMGKMLFVGSDSRKSTLAAKRVCYRFWRLAELLW